MHNILEILKFKFLKISPLSLSALICLSTVDTQRHLTEEMSN